VTQSRLLLQATGRRPPYTAGVAVSVLLMKRQHIFPLPISGTATPQCKRTFFCTTLYEMETVLEQFFMSLPLQIYFVPYILYLLQTCCPLHVPGPGPFDKGRGFLCPIVFLRLRHMGPTPAFIFLRFHPRHSFWVIS
jgi:hypothetical protein